MTAKGLCGENGGFIIKNGIIKNMADFDDCEYYQSFFIDLILTTKL